MKNYLTIARMLLTGAILGVLYWLLDSAVDSLLLKKSSYLLQVISTDPGELWMRLFGLFSFIGFGYYAGILISRAKKNITARKAAEIEMEKLSTAVETAADMIVITDNKGIIEYVNPAFEAVTGYTREVAIGKTPRILKSGVHGLEFYRELWDIILSGNIYRNVFVNRKKNGELYYDECTITPMRNQQNIITHFIATAKVITERIMAEKALRESEERLRTITQMAASAIVMIDATGAISFWNPAAEKLFVYSAEEAMGMDLHKIIVPQRHYEAFQRGFARFSQTGEGAVVGKTMEMTARKKDGREFPVELSISGIRNKEQWHAVGIIRDITERKQAEHKLREYAEKDSLTGLLNRRKFYELLEQEKERAVRYARPLSLVMFDIDHFKIVNDTYGHSAGDKVLKTTAAVVTDHIRESDILGRVGGEEFAVLATETTTEHALTLAEKIRCAVEMAEHDHNGKITVSLGVSAYDNGLTLDEFVRRADKALYAAKNNGRNRVECY